MESASFSVVSNLLTEDHAEAMRKHYGSDLTDSQWQKIEAVLSTSRHRQHNLHRDILDGLLYLLQTGCPWRMLPAGFAPWQTVYYYFRKWKKRGVIERLLSVVRREARKEAGREADPSAVIIDCQSVPIIRSGDLSGFDGNKRIKGRKRHIALDTQGWTWSVDIHAANQHESQHALGLLEETDAKSERLEAVFANKAYRGDLEDEIRETLGLRLEITEPNSEEPGFSVEPKRWIVERTLGWFGGWWRLSKEYERLAETSGNGPAHVAPTGPQPPLTVYQTASYSAEAVATGSVFRCAWSACSSVSVMCWKAVHGIHSASICEPSGRVPVRMVWANMSSVQALAARRLGTGGPPGSGWGSPSRLGPWQVWHVSAAR